MQVEGAAYAKPRGKCEQARWMERARLERLESRKPEHSQAGAVACTPQGHTGC